ncbi:MAG: hypothetical protein GQ542_12105, partial [Desulforhopalus sp.]|nr:hypothetical protein [Desulforhopalus sp.]
MSLSSESIRKSPLSLQLTFYIIIYSLLLTLVSAVLQATLEYRQSLQAIQANLQLIEDSYLQTIAASNYDVNEDLLEVQLQGLIQLRDIVYAEITEPDRAETYMLSAGNPATRRDIERTFPLRYQTADGETYEIGTLTVVANLDGLYSRLGERIAGILAENVLRIFLITLFMLFLTRSIVTRHLSKIASYSDKVNLVQLEELTLERSAGKWFRPDEFDRLVAA